MMSTLKRQCNCQVQRFCVTQVCLYMLSVINKHLCSLLSTQHHIWYSALYAVAHPSVRPSVCLSVCHTGGCIDVACLPLR